MHTRSLLVGLCLMAAAAGWADKDVTSLYITNADLSTNSNNTATGWTLTNITAVGTYNNCSAAEYWTASGNVAFGIKQSVTLPAGSYRLEADAFHRPGSDQEATTQTVASLYAGSASTYITALYGITATSKAGSLTQAAGVLEQGEYVNSVTFTLSEQSSIEIGVSGTHDAGSSWCVVGGFRLYDTAADADYPLDYSGSIANRSFELGDASGWTDTSVSMGMQSANYTGLTGGYFVERWVWSASDNVVSLSSSSIGGEVYQTLTALPEGIYVVQADMMNQQQGDASLATGGMYFFAAAGDNEQTAEVSTNGNSAGDSYSLTVKLAAGESLRLGMRLDGCTGNWVAMDNFRLTMYPVLTAQTGTMCQTVSEAQTTALAAYEAGATATTYAAALAAVAAAKASAERYDSIAYFYAKLDDAGKAAFDDSEAGKAYNNKTLTVDDDYAADLVAACLAQTSDGADMTYLLLATAWTCPQGNGPTIIQTTATETYKESDYVAGKVMYQRIDNLPEGNYELTYYYMTNSAWGKSSYGDEMAQLYANQTTSKVSVVQKSTGTVAEEANLQTVTLDVHDALGGYLEYGIRNLKEAGNWYVMDPVSLRRVGGVTAQLSTEWAGDHAVGDVVTAGGKDYTILAANMLVNGSFEAGVKGWQSTSYAEDAETENYTMAVIDGYDGGAYVTPSAGGKGDATSLMQSVELTSGRTYYYEYYTMGSVSPEQAGLEVGDEMAGSTSWVSQPAASDDWAMTSGVFEATTSHAGFRASWISGMALDGVQIYEVQEVVDFPVHECDNTVADWTITTDGTALFQTNTWSSEGESDGSGMTTPFVEYWQDSGNLADAVIAHSTITDLYAGQYTISFLARVWNSAGTDPSGFTFTANGSSVDLCSGTSTTYSGAGIVYGNYSVTVTVAEGGSLDMSFATSNATGNWLAFKDLTVTTTTPPTLAAAEGKMNADKAAAQASALAAYQVNATSDNYTAALAAIATAQESVDYYATVTAVIEEFSGDEKAMEAWKTTDGYAKYEACTLDGDDLTADYATAQAARTTAGDMTYVVLNMDVTTWTAGKGSEDKTYLTGYQSYQKNGFSASDGVILSQTVTGLPQGNYEVRFYGVANSTNWSGTHASGEGIVVAFANEATAPVTVGTDKAVETITSEDYLRTLECYVYGTGDGAGQLQYGLQNVADGGDWYVCQAAGLTYLGAADFATGYTYKIETVTASQTQHLQPGNQVTLTLSGETDNALAELALTDKAAVTLGDTELAVNTDGMGIIVTLPTELDTDTTYTLTIAAGAAAYTVDGVTYGTNEALDVKVRTAALFDQKKVYLYNEETGRFLSRGANWGTAAIADLYGLPVNISTTSEGVTTVAFPDNSLYLGIASSWMWADSDTAAELTAAASGEGVTLKTTEGYAYIYSESDTDQYRVAANGTSECVWQVKTREERDAIKAARSTISTDEYGGFEDLTYTIEDASLTATSSLWAIYTWEGGTTTNSVAADGTVSLEGWSAVKGGYITRTITDLPSGLYRVTLQGFARQGSATYCTEMKDYDLSTAYIEANGEQTSLATWASGSMPTDSTAAIAAFAEGEYTNTVIAKVDTDGKLTLNIHLENYVSTGVWYCLRNLNVARLLSEYQTLTLTYADVVCSNEDGAGYYTTFCSAADAQLPVYTTPSPSAPAAKATNPAPYTLSKIVSADGGVSLYFTEVTAENDYYQLAAGQGYLLRKECADGSGKLSVPSVTASSDVAAPEVNLLVGVTSPVVVTSSNYSEIYVMSIVDTDTQVGTIDGGTPVYGQGLGFYHLKVGGTIAAGKAYVLVNDETVSTESTTTGVARMVFGGEDDEVTGIAAAAVSAAPQGIYDMSGRRVSRAGKGIYIINGKKVLK